MKIVCVVLLASVALFGSVKTQDCDSVNRVDCGYVGITEVDCEARDCCFDNSTQDKWCFNKGNTDVGYSIVNSDGGSLFVPYLQELCQRDPDDRVDCGFFGINQKECEAKSCCWDDSENGAAFCFNKNPIKMPENCVIDSNKRAECGWLGITKKECDDRACCYDNSYSNSPWCFNPLIEQNEECIISGENRVDCGWVGILQDQCETKGCCYDNSERDVPFCYNMKSDCFIPGDEREDCGFYGITQEQCKEKSCCFDSSYKNAPWCFSSK